MQPTSPRVAVVSPSIPSRPTPWRAGLAYSTNTNFVLCVCRARFLLWLTAGAGKCWSWQQEKFVVEGQGGEQRPGSACWIWLRLLGRKRKRDVSKSQSISAPKVLMYSLILSISQDRVSQPF